MAEVITSSTPTINFRGTKDNGGNRAQGAPEVLPFHRPLHFFFAEKGPTEATFNSTAMFAQLYGDKVLDLNSEYATHVTPYLKEAIAAVSRFMAIRVLPADMPDKSNLGVSLDYLETAVPLYERNTDGSYKLDKNGLKVPTGDTTPGIIAKFVVELIGHDDQGDSLIGRRQVEDGSMTADGVTSKKVPFLDLEALDYGDGTNIGFRLFAPTTQSATPADSDLNDDVGAFLYRLQLMSRDTLLDSPKIVQTTYSESSINVSFGQNILDKTGAGTILDFEERVPARWSDTDVTTYQRSPVGAPHVYHDLIDALLAKIAANEKTFGTVIDGESVQKINFISGTTVDAVPYYSYIVQGVLDGGVSFVSNATHWLKGGGTGTMNNTTYNAAVNKILSDLEGDYHLTNIPRYPFNAFWDTGFDEATKLLIPKIQSARQDSWIAICTQDMLQAPNDVATDESMATALITRLQQYPDSVEFGTLPFRGILTGQMGDYVGATRKYPVPLNLDLYRKICMWGRDESGRANEDNAPDLGAENATDDNRVITRVKNITNLDMIYRNRRRLWLAGVVYCEDYDTSAQFFAGLQSFYPDQTSVLRSALVGLCVANINHYAWRVWRTFTGNQNLTDEQLVERSEKLITQLTTDNISSGRMIAKHHAELTRTDEENGYSWTLRSDIGVSGMRTVLNASVVAYRREELEDNG